METEKVLPEILPAGEPAVDFDKIVQESKETLAEVTQPKRGRGRPRKEQAAPKADPKKDPAFKDVDAVILKEHEIEPLSIEVVKAPFDMLSWKYEADLTPTDTEAKAPAKYLAKLIESYLPDIGAKDPRTFNLVAFLITYALLGIKKIRGLKKTKTENKNAAAGSDSPAPDEAPQPQAQPLPAESIPASSMFTRGPL